VNYESATPKSTQSKTTVSPMFAKL
jgi:hypothetical protein